MKCPHCGCEHTRVSDSRITDNGGAIRRRRVCEQCSFRFTTFEKPQSVELVVEKKDGTFEPYDREKLEKAILLACGKRPVSLPLIREKLAELESQWAKQKILPSYKIGEDVIAMLQDIDEVAFIRFMSVYKEFKDVKDFQKELDNLLQSKRDLAKEDT